MKKAAIVGMGRTGTTIVREILSYFYYGNTNKHKAWADRYIGSQQLEYDHWDKSNISLNDPNRIIIICKRDLRDVLASSFRSVADPLSKMYDDKKFIINKIDNFPSNFKRYKEKYGISESEIIQYGKKLMTEGWSQWIEHVDYIFCYEDYMKDPHKITQEITDILNIKNPSIIDAINSTIEWKDIHPSHITNKGLSNAWHDIFSKAQEKIILDNFGYWLKEQNYIK